MSAPALLYLHIPFCLRKCAYCDFYSESGHALPRRIDYARGLMRELQAAATGWQEHEFETMYLGGGTPSLIPASEIKLLVMRARELYRFMEQPEISLEINPATLTLPELYGLQEAGVNRLSIGVQSFNDDELKLLGRSHSVQHSNQLIAAAKEAGFQNVNLDLIYGLPGQSMAAWQENIAQAAATGCTHISAYLLQLDDACPMARQVAAGELVLPEEDIQAEMYDMTRLELKKAGYAQYEISNFALSGYECRHNTGYWQMKDYLGIGAGAVSRRAGRRCRNPQDLRAYSDAGGALPAPEAIETMDASGLLTEAMIMGLRMNAGVDPAALQARFGAELTPEQHAGLRRCIAAGLLEAAGERLRLSEQGFFLSNQVFERLL
ncbi:MAG: radical SAM family heme chaperone HemW [Syntrophomonadaceae bacterium]|nr:radical SAM family heme chaperone HemW [Syntrophomonadaceae bacterium]